MTFKRALLTTTVLVAAMAASPALASNKKPDGRAELEDRVRQLEQQLEDIRIQMGSQIKEIQTRQDAVVTTIDNGRPVIRSGDGNFEAALRARMHFDAGIIYQDRNLPVAIVGAARDLGSGATMRRGRVGLEGRLFRVFDYETSFNFAGNGGAVAASIEAFRLGYTGIGRGIRIDAGIFKPQMTYEHMTSSNDITFIERGGVINALTDAYGGAAQRQAIQVSYQQTNALMEGDNLLISTAYTGNLNGAPVNTGDNRSHWVGRAVYRFLNQDLFTAQAGGSWGYVIDDGNAAGVQIRDRIENRLNDDRLVDTGNITAGNSSDGALAYGFEGALGYDNLLVFGEWYDMTVPRPGFDDAEFSGWYVAGSWVVTGEQKNYGVGSATFGSPRPTSPWVLGATTGAVELTARYSLLDVNHNEGILGAAAPGGTNPGIRGGEQTVASVGVNWYLNRNVRFILNHQFTEIERLNAAGAALDQDLQATVLRTQFSF